MPGLEHSFGFHTSTSAYGLMSDGVASEQVKKFFFTSGKASSRDNDEEDEADDSLEVYIPELLQANYYYYTWPAAPVLAWYLWEHRKELPGKRVLELGSGTALPGIVASKCGAVVTLSDSATLPKCLQHIRRSCELNGVLSQVKVVGITWGIFLSNLFKLGHLDLILGSDLFYDPSVFEDIVVTIAFLLERNPAAKFLCTYQERSSDWSIEHLLNKWNLTCSHISLDNLGADSGLDVQELMQANLAWTTGSNELKTYFEKFGAIRHAFVRYDKETGLSKNFGRVEFRNEESAKAAIESENHVIDGRKVDLKKY